MRWGVQLRPWLGTTSEMARERGVTFFIKLLPRFPARSVSKHHQNHRGSSRCRSGSISKHHLFDLSEHANKPPIGLRHHQHQSSPNPCLHLITLSTSTYHFIGLWQPDRRPPAKTNTPPRIPEEKRSQTKQTQVGPNPLYLSTGSSGLNLPGMSAVVVRARSVSTSIAQQLAGRGAVAAVAFTGSAAFTLVKS